MRSRLVVLFAVVVFALTGTAAFAQRSPPALMSGSVLSSGGQTPAERGLVARGAGPSHLTGPAEQVFGWIRPSSGLILWTRRWNMLAKRLGTGAVLAALVRD